VALEAIRAVADAFTGRRPQTSLTEALCALMGVADPAALLEKISRSVTGLNYVEPSDARIAPTVIAVAEAGDAAARDILERAGSALGDSAALVARRLAMLDDAFEVV